jgi:gamma-butyrobetaine hydroxylase
MPKSDQDLTARIEDDGRVLAVLRNAEVVTRFPALWVRDNTPDDRDPGNGQKLTNITDLPADPRVTSMEKMGDGQVTLVFKPDGKRACFDLETLLAAGNSPPRTRRTWTARDFTKGPPTSSWAGITSDPKSLESWLTAVSDHGLAVLTGLPAEENTVTSVAELFGHVRETNYGRLFDVRAEADPINLAYTGMALSVHTDNPYRDPVPTIQLLHCLENEADGGDTVLVDGFNASEHLRQDDPSAFEILTRTWVAFAYVSTGTRLTARRPMISLDDKGQVIEVRFNNRSLAPLDMPTAELSRFYRAYRRFAEILFDPAASLTFKLNPGELFAVDNRRVLHGRTAFSSTGRRHLQGCYADMDGLMSRLAVLEREGA